MSRPRCPNDQTTMVPDKFDAWECIHCGIHTSGVGKLSEIGKWTGSPALVVEKADDELSKLYVDMLSKTMNVYIDQLFEPLIVETAHWAWQRFYRELRDGALTFLQRQDPNTDSLIRGSVIRELIRELREAEGWED